MTRVKSAAMLKLDPTVRALTQLREEIVRIGKRVDAIEGVLDSYIANKPIEVEGGVVSNAASVRQLRKKRGKG